VFVAHTTQFTEIGWFYLQHGRGVGKLTGGGSFVTLASPDLKHFTIIIETMVSTASQLFSIWLCILAEIWLVDWYGGSNSWCPIWESPSPLKSTAFTSAALLMTPWCCACYLYTDVMIWMMFAVQSHNHSLCIRPGLPSYTVVPQQANFQLAEHLVCCLFYILCLLFPLLGRLKCMRCRRLWLMVS